MKIWKTLFTGALTAAVLFGLCLPVWAEAPAGDAEESAPGAAAAEAAAGTGEAEEAAYSVLDEAELSALVEAFMTERKLDGEHFSLGYCYTGTGETWYYGGDTFYEGASLYKLSLMMGLARLVSSGELGQEDILYGMTVSQIEKQALTYSVNEISEKMIQYFSPFKEYRQMQAELAGFAEEELPDNYFNHNIYSPRFMIGVLQNLYENPEEFPNVTECLLDAQPEHYFRLNLEGKYDIAQKYGSAEHYIHTAGILYTPTPCLLVVMTHNAYAAEKVIGAAAELLAEYTLTLDERLSEQKAEAEAQAEQERLAAAQAEAEAKSQAAEAEEQRRQAEAQAQAEAAVRAEAQAAQSQQAEQTLRERTLARQQTQTDAVILRAIVYALAAVLALLVCYFALRRYRSGRQNNSRR